MSSREAILPNIRKALSQRAGRFDGFPPRGAAGLAPWNPAAAAMAGRFAQELAEVHGEAFRWPRWTTPAEAGRAVPTAGLDQLARIDRPLCRRLPRDCPPSVVTWAHPIGSRRTWPSCRWAWSRPISCWPTRGSA